MKYALAFTLCMIPAMAGAETFNVPCGPYDDAVSQLQSKYKEELAEGGLTTGGKGVFEIWVAPDGTTWTALFHGPDGSSCLVAAGTDWGAVRPQGEAL